MTGICRDAEVHTWRMAQQRAPSLCFDLASEPWLIHTKGTDSEARTAARGALRRIFCRAYLKATDATTDVFEDALMLEFFKCKGEQLKKQLCFFAFCSQEKSSIPRKDAMPGVKVGGSTVTHQSPLFRTTTSSS